MYARSVTWIVRMVIAAAINVLALIVADWVFDGLAVGRWGSIILAGIVLGLANVFLKPLVTFIALPLILLTCAYVVARRSSSLQVVFRNLLLWAGSMVVVVPGLVRVDGARATPRGPAFGEQ